ncbi:1804_t:CDS:2, partial [Scutellospora calospora]
MSIIQARRAEIVDASNTILVAQDLQKICRYPKTKDKVYNELRDIFEDELCLNYKYINSLKYVDMCIKESLRLISTIPFSLRTIVIERFLECDDITRNSYIPFGNRVRECSEKHLALFAMKVVFILFLKRYDIELVDSE